MIEINSRIKINGAASKPDPEMLLFLKLMPEK